MIGQERVEVKLESSLSYKTHRPCREDSFRHRFQNELRNAGVALVCSNFLEQSLHGASYVPVLFHLTFIFHLIQETIKQPEALGYPVESDQRVYK
jgi:hypothetical protein